MRFIAFSGPTICGPSQALVDKHVRTSDDPCGLFCRYADFQGWKAAARDALNSVLQGRPDLPSAMAEQMREYLREVNAMEESTLGLSSKVHRLAQIHQAANCVATWKTDDTPPELPVDPPTHFDANRLLWIGGAIFVGAMLWRMTK